MNANRRLVLDINIPHDGTEFDGVRLINATIDDIGALILIRNGAYQLTASDIPDPAIIDELINGHPWPEEDDE